MGSTIALLHSLINSSEEFAELLKNILRTNNITLKEFSKLADIPETTIYKISSGKQTNFEINNLRSIIKAIQKIEHTNEEFIALIAPRITLQQVEERNYFVENRAFNIKEYPCKSIEEIIVNAVKAERDGAAGIICGPLSSDYIKDLVSIPIELVMDTNIHQSINSIVKKLSE